MNILIVGLGSIAIKHIRAIKETFECSYRLYGLRSSKNSKPVDGVEDIYDFNNISIEFDFIIISNPTNLHIRSIMDLTYLGVPFFIEKPLAEKLDGLDIFEKELKKKNIKNYIACNLRFHGCNQFVKSALDSGEWGKIDEVNAYCGSYLPEWRPEVKNFRENYSANETMGGGVHLDLIHELDYLFWFFGMPERTNRFFKKKSSLNISAVDSAHYVLEYADFICQLSLNYYRKSPKRGYEIITSKHIIEVDLMLGNILKDKVSIFEVEPDESVSTYTKQMKYFKENVLNSDCLTMNQIYEARKVLNLCLNE